MPLNSSDYFMLSCPIETFALRDCQQLTFVTLNRFCPLSKPPTPHPLSLMDNIKMDKIPTKTKCKIHAPFVLINFYKT